MVATVPIILVSVVAFFAGFVDSTVATTAQDATAQAAAITDKIIAQDPSVTLRVRLARWELRGKGVGTSHKHHAKYHG
jgi:sensor histidine kinase regulating citrate/malate metabolism